MDQCRRTSQVIFESRSWLDFRVWCLTREVFHKEDYATHISRNSNLFSKTLPALEQGWVTLD